MATKKLIFVYIVKAMIKIHQLVQQVVKHITLKQSKNIKSTPFLRIRHFGYPQNAFLQTIAFSGLQG